MRHLTRAALAGLIAAAALPAAAHHPLGGETPATLLQGVLSGVGHPMIGLDHLAFIVAMGIAAALTGRALSAPLAFVATMLAGTAAGAAGLSFALTEFAVAGSVLAIGAVVLSGRTIGAGALLGLFALAGLVHGLAFAEAVIGAEAAPIAGYLAGLGVVQYAIAVAAGLAIRAARAGEPAAIPARLAGAVVAGIGATFLIEGIEGALFGAIG